MPIQKDQYTTILHTTLSLIKDAASLGLYVELCSLPEGPLFTVAHLMQRFDMDAMNVLYKLQPLETLRLLKYDTFFDERSDHSKVQVTVFHAPIKRNNK